MDANLTEEQQVEIIKKFWKEYGFSIIAGIILAIGIGFGWRAYQQHRYRQAEHASSLYERLIVDTMNNQINDARLQAQTLMHDFKHTPYASLAAFTLAKFAVENNQLDQASKYLNWVLDHSHHEFRQIARLRLARVYLTKNKPDDALKLLQKVDSRAFMPLILELRGDAYLKKNSIDNARKNYQAALKQLPEQATMRSLLEMKLNDLPKANN